MEKAKEQLDGLINNIIQIFPEESDLKGFLGISKSLILSTLRVSEGLLVALKDYDDQFETILLKRELADLFEKIDRDLDENFDKIKPSQFNSLLKHFSKMRFAIKETYISLTSELPLRTESEMAKVKEELNALSAEKEELIKIFPELNSLKSSTVQAIDDFFSIINSEKVKIISMITKDHEEIMSLKESAVKNITSVHDQIVDLEKSAIAISSDLVHKQKAALENSTSIAGLMIAAGTSKSTIETIEKSTIGSQQEIDTTKDEIAKYSVEYNNLNARLKTFLEETESTHDKIFGKKGEDGILVKGYFQDTEELKNQMELFLKEQHEKFVVQFREIEGLLPGATSAGLAEAYQVQKLSYKRPIQLWSAIFIIAVTAMASLSISLIYLQSKSAVSQTLNDAFIGLLKDLPFFIPTLWLASYASKQQSQYKRLQQEYAFKETNAKSFHGHKIQIEALTKDGVTDTNLLMQLVAQLVVITSQNPSVTLDNKDHEDSSPILKLVERFFPSFSKRGSDFEKGA